MKRFVQPFATICLIVGTVSLSGCAPEQGGAPSVQPTPAPTTSAPLADDELLALAEDQFQGYFNTFENEVNADTVSSAAMSEYIAKSLLAEALDGIDTVREMQLTVKGAPRVIASSLVDRSEMSSEVHFCVDRSTSQLIDEYGLVRPPAYEDELAAYRVIFEFDDARDVPLITALELIGESETAPCEG